MTLRVCAVLLTLMMSCAGFAAPDVPPPLNALWDRDTVLGEATYVGAPAPGRLLFRDVRVVHGGQDRSELSVRADAKALALVQEGRRYVLAWQETRRSPTSKKLRIVRPEGPQLFDSVGLSPALFEATEPLRALLLTPPDVERLQDEAHLERVLQGLEQGAPQLQQLFAGEVFARPSLLAQLDRRSVRRLQAFVRDDGRDTQARDLVLQAAHIHGRAFGQGWDALAARLLAHEPVGTHPDQENEGLIWTAFAMVEAAQRALPVQTSRRWVSSGNGALAEHALRALRRDAPGQELRALEAALAEPDLAEGTRALLIDHRRRMQRVAST
jgi:hypothetical protein